MATIHTTAPSPYSLTILGGPQSYPMYQGTVPERVVAARRAANRRSRASRRINRRSK